MKLIVLALAALVLVNFINLLPQVQAVKLNVPALFTNSSTAFKLYTGANACKAKCTRRSIRTWSNEDFQLYGKLMNEFNKRGYLEEFIVAHSWNTTITPELTLNYHGSKAFFPWHRFYTTHIEQLLQKIDHEINPGKSQQRGEFCLGYWDWGYQEQYANSFDKAAYKYLFADRGIGTLNLGFNPIPDSPFKNFTIVNGDKLPKELLNPIFNVHRDPTVFNSSIFPPGAPVNASLFGWSKGQIASCLSRTNYEEAGFNGNDGTNEALGLGFRTCVEGPIHGTVHSSIGGEMGNVPASPADPVFWFHHTMVDYLWWKWSKNTNNTIAPIVDFTVPNPAPYQQWTLNDSKDNGRFCYDYAEKKPTPYTPKPLASDYPSLDQASKNAVFQTLTEGETQAIAKDKFSFLQSTSNSQADLDKMYQLYVNNVYFAQLQYKKIYDRYAKSFNTTAQPSTLSAKNVVQSNSVNTRSTGTNQVDSIAQAANQTDLSIYLDVLA